MSARAVTGRRSSPTVGWGKTFWRVGRVFTEAAVSRSRKVAQSIRRCKIDRLAEGYKQAIDKNPGSYSKKRIFGPKSEFLGPIKTFTSRSKPCSSHDRAKLCKEKSTLFLNNYQSFNYWIKCFFGKKRIFGPKTAFQQNGRFSFIPARTRSLVNMGQFLVARTHDCQ